MAFGVSYQDFGLCSIFKSRFRTLFGCVLSDKVLHIENHLDIFIKHNL